MKRFTALLLVAVVATATLTGCDTVRSGTRCKAGSPPGRDATHVLFCTKGRWTRTLTIGQAAEILLGGQVAKIETVATKTVATGRAGGSVTVYFSVTSRNGKPVRGAKVVLGGPSSGARLAATASTTGETVDDGTVGFALPLDTVAGSFDLTATVDGTKVSTAVGVTVTAGAATRAEIVSGNNQSVNSGARLDPVVVKATDAYGNAAAGQVIAVVDGPVSVPGSVKAQATTDSTGTATFSTLDAQIVIVAQSFVLYVVADAQFSTTLGSFTYASRAVA